MKSPLVIGLVEDNPGDARLIQEMLGESPVTPFRVDWSSRLDDVLVCLERESFDVLLLDLGLPDSQGLATFDQVHTHAPTIPIIIFSGAIDEELAVEAVAHGAQDYLVKGQIDSLQLKRAIRYAIERKHAERIQAESAHENVLLVEDLRSRQVVLEQHRRLATFVADVGVALADSTTISHMLTRCARLMVQHVDAAFARVWTLNIDDQILELEASAGLSTHLDGLEARVPMGAFKIGLIAQERSPHTTNAVIGDPRVADQEWAAREGMVSFAGYPLTTGEDLLGVMAIFARTPLSDETLQAMASVAPEIAIGLARKRAEQQLKLTLERTTFALDAAHMGVWELDLRSDRLFWSETMAPLFGLTPERAPRTGQAFFKLIHPDDRQTVEDRIQSAVQDGVDLVVEFRRASADNQARWIYAQGRLLPDDLGHPTRLSGVGMDISERRSLEEQLRQSQKLEAVGQLAGGVAHDFNNLLTAILGYSTFVVDSFERDDPRRYDLEQVILAGQRAATLTRQLLAFSRKQVLEPRAVDLNVLVTDMRPMLSRLIGEDVDLVIVSAPELGTVRADPGQLEQVLMNLVVNARDAMPTGGRLVVETANAELDDSFLLYHTPIRPGSYVMLAVSDSGVGIDDDTKRRLFEPFFTTKEPGKGTGLGLATVYGIVQQSSGYIWVYSEPGNGATFKVYLPRAEQADEVESVGVDEEMAVGTEAVLVVEDEEAVRLLTRMVLEKAGYSVVDAPDALQAEALFKQNVNLFSLLVTDVIMPGLSGPKLFERLAHHRPDLKVLYVSGYTGDAIAHHGQLEPGTEFVQKPFTAKALGRKVREVLDR